MTISTFLSGRDLGISVASISTFIMASCTFLLMIIVNCLAFLKVLTSDQVAITCGIILVDYFGHPNLSMISYNFQSTGEGGLPPEKLWQVLLLPASVVIEDYSLFMNDTL